MRRIILDPVVVSDLIGNCVDHAHYPSTVPHVIAKHFMHGGYSYLSQPIYILYIQFLFLYSTLINNKVIVYIVLQAKYIMSVVV